MKLNFYKTLLTSLILISASTLWASPQLERVRDIGYSIEDSRNWIYEFKFSDNQKLKLKNNNCTYTFLMIDGSIISNLNLPIINGRSFVPLRFLSERLGMIVQWDSSSKTAYIEKDSNHISVIANKNTYDIQTINNSIYVSIRFLEQKFPLAVSYHPLSLDESNPFNILLHPMVTVDSNNVHEILTKNQAIDLAKSNLLKAYNNFLSNSSYNSGTDDSQVILNTLKSDINSISYLSKISRYYILDGPYTILVDAVTGSLYFKKDKINRSFIEPVDLSNLEIFADNYFIN